MMGIDRQTDKQTDGQTQLTRTTLRPMRPRVKKRMCIFYGINCTYLFVKQSSFPILPRTPAVVTPFVSICVTYLLQGPLLLDTIDPGVGVTKSQFVTFSASKSFDRTKVPLRLFELRLYLTGVAAAQLPRHLPNINLMFNSWRVLWRCWKFHKITEWREWA